MSKIKCNQIESIDGTVTYNVKDLGISITSGGDDKARWTKFPDGTMIIYLHPTTRLTTTTASGNVFRTGKINMPFPEFFISPPVVTFSTTPSTGVSWASAWSPALKEKCSGVVFGTTDIVTCTLSCIAIGRWK